MRCRADEISGWILAILPIQYSNHENIDRVKRPNHKNGNTQPQRGLFEPLNRQVSRSHITVPSNTEVPQKQSGTEEIEP